MARETPILLGCCWFLVAAVLAGASEPEQGFAELVDVRVVNVEIFVTDRKGEPIRGLTAADFEVYDDGRQVELTHFFEKSETAHRAASPDPAIAELPTTLEGRPPLLDEKLTLVIYVDNSTLIAAHRNRVLGDLIEFLAAQAERTDLRYSLATFDTELEVLVPFSDRVEPILEGLAEVRRSRTGGLREVAERRQVLHTLIDLHRELGGCAESWSAMVSTIDGFAQTMSRRLIEAQGGLISLTRSLSGLPGRKAILYLSDGLQQMPGLALHDYIGELCPTRTLEATSNALVHDESALFEELTAFANTHSVTYYPLETAGLKSLSIESVEWAPEDHTVIVGTEQIDSPQPGPLYGYKPSPRNDQVRDVNYKAGLAIMAKGTGGQAIFNSNSPRDQLDRVARDFDNYYSLGFSPAAGWDGERHKIFVRLVGEAAKGRSLRYRKTYQAVSRDEWMAERAVGALVLGLEENPLGIDVDFGDSELVDGGAHRIPLEISIGLDSLVLLGEPLARGLVRVVVVAPDLRNRRSPVREQLVPIELPRSIAGSTARRRLVVELELRSGEHWIGVAVRDEIGAVASYLRRRISLPSEVVPAPIEEPVLAE